MNQQVVLFDIDGTLLTTGGAGTTALNRAFSTLFGVQGAFDGISFVGSMDCILFSNAARKNLGRELSGEETETLANLYTSELEDAFNTHPFKVYPGARECLEVLSSQPDLHFGIATGNLESAAWAKLRHGQLSDYFVTGGFGMQGPRREDMTAAAWEQTTTHFKLPGQTSGFLVGDSVHDIRCAKAIGVIAIGVTTGWTDSDALIAAGADVIFDSLERLPDFIHSSNRG